MRELLVVLDGLVVGLRGARRRALDGLLGDIRRKWEAADQEITALRNQTYNDRHKVGDLERERRGLQKRIATLETEHKAEVAKYKAALADVAKDLAKTGSAKDLVAAAKAAGQDSLGLVNDPETVAILEAKAKANQ